MTKTKTILWGWILILSSANLLLAQQFDTLGLWRDGVDAATKSTSLPVGATRQGGSHRSSVIGGDQLFGHDEDISMARRGHSATQMPQPLQ